MRRFVLATVTSVAAVLVTLAPTGAQAGEPLTRDDVSNSSRDVVPAPTREEVSNSSMERGEKRSGLGQSLSGSSCVEVHRGGLGWRGC